MYSTPAVSNIVQYNTAPAGTETEAAAGNDKVKTVEAVGAVFSYKWNENGETAFALATAGSLVFHSKVLNPP